MTISDKIYGKIKIEEPVLLELFNAPSILRLKRISQYGIPDRYYSFKNYSRYEHSVGVIIILKKLGATLEEQIVGLLHDVSVLTFSHVADWVFSEGSNGVEDFHDKLHKKFVKDTEIPKILERFNFSLERILDEENFTLLEKKIPDLCADRVDYALREFQSWLNPNIVGDCINALVNFNGEMVFGSRKTAFNFAVNFLELQTRHWGGYDAMMRYYFFSKALKLALSKKILFEKDFYKNEPFVLGKLERGQDKAINKILTALRDKDLKDIKANSGKRVIKKFRYVDPKIISDKKLVRLSELNPEFTKILAKHQKINKKGLIV